MRYYANNHTFDTCVSTRYKLVAPDIHNVTNTVTGKPGDVCLSPATVFQNYFPDVFHHFNPMTNFSTSCT